MMTQKVIRGNDNLGKMLKLRRNELGLTIEEAATRAGVGTKTWSRYEAGESIRTDKCKGICKSLNWKRFPTDKEENIELFSIQKYKDCETWSSFLENEFGIGAAMSFSEGSDILFDYINDDMKELSSLPTGSHIGQLSISWLNGILPEQFLMNYNYEFLYLMKCSLYKMRIRAKNGKSLFAHSVIEELLLYLCCEEAYALLELNSDLYEKEGIDDEHFKDWVFDLFGDMDLITFLYSNVYLDVDHPYHFSHWKDQQFYTE